MKASRFITLLVVALAGAALFPGTGSSAGDSRQIYFFERPSSPVGGTGFHVHNPLVVRPEGMPLFGLYTPGSGDPVGVPGDSGGALRLTDFMSPDRKVWCQIYSFAAVCGTEPEPPTHSAELKPDGKVSLCSVLRTEYPEGSKVPLTCFQNWPRPGDHVPVLKIGTVTRDSGFRCTSTAGGIVCTDVAGAGKGHGFRIDKDDAVELTQR